MRLCLLLLKDRISNLEVALSAVEEGLISQTSFNGLACILHTCRKERDSRYGLRLYDYMCQHGLHANPVLGNELIPMLVDIGSINDAQHVFDSLHYRNDLSWNSLIMAYVKSGKSQIALNLYNRMQRDAAIRPSKHTIVALLKACGRLKDQHAGVSIHKHLLRTGFSGKEPFIGNALVSMYGKCGLLEKAVEVFEALLVHDVVSWTSLITAYVESGLETKALDCLDQMQIEGVSPNALTLVCCLKACTNTRDIEKGEELHSEIERRDLVLTNIFIGSTLVDMYAKWDCLDKARVVFDSLPVQDVISWNALINGYVEHGHNEEVLMYFEKMQLEGISRNEVTCISCLKACGNIGAIVKGKEVHNEIENQSSLWRTNLAISNTLIDMYVRCGIFDKAQEVFNNLSTKDVIAWTTLIAGYVEYGHCEEALKCFGDMQGKGIPVDAAIFVCVLKACATLKAKDKGEEIHAEIEKNGLLERNHVLGNSLIDMYIKCGLLDKAEEVFKKLPTRDFISWNALLSGYVDHGDNTKAIECFNQMKSESVQPYGAALTCVLKACTVLGDYSKAYEIQSEIEETGLLEMDNISLFEMYVKCGWLDKAHELFDKLPYRDAVSWNTLVIGYADHGYWEHSIRCYEQMRFEGIAPDASTFICILKACSNIRDLKKGQEIHEEIVRNGLFKTNIVLGNSLVNMYAERGLLSRAREVFEKLPAKDSVSWNILITAFSEHGQDVEALSYLDYMKVEGLSPNPVTYASILKACGNVQDIEKGQLLHAELTKQGLHEKHPYIGSALVNMYAKFGMLGIAEKVFNELPTKDVVSWNALISAYVEHGQSEEALNVLEWMQFQGLSPSSITFISSLKACGSLGATIKGQELHAEIARKGLLQKDIVVGNTLIDMYAQSGSTGLAQEVLDKLVVRDVVSWSSLIAGYAQTGESENVFCNFDRMLGEGLNPDPVTYVIVLNACSREGLFYKSQTYFECMFQEHGITPELEHHSCMVDLLSRSGQLDEALTVVQKMSCSPNMVVWLTMLGACKNWGNAGLAKQAFEKAVYFDDKDGAAYALMSQVYADTNILQEKEKKRVLMPGNG